MALPDVCVDYFNFPTYAQFHVFAFSMTQILMSLVTGLARLPVVNSYARTPPLVWKMGWMPSPTGKLSTHLPPLPLDFLQERDVLKDFIFRVNTIGKDLLLFSPASSAPTSRPCRSTSCRSEMCLKTSYLGLIP